MTWGSARLLARTFKQAYHSHGSDRSIDFDGDPLTVAVIDPIECSKLPPSNERAGYEVSRPDGVGLLGNKQRYLLWLG